MKLKSILIPLAAACLLGACSNAREALIPSKKAPDEFAVYTRAPLVVPPEFDLRAPAPGQERPQSVNPKDIAEQAVLGSDGGNASAAQPVTPGVQALLDNTGASQADPSIRQLVNEETSILAIEDKTLTETIIFWNTPTEYGAEVNAEEEAKRIQENQALGQPLTTGEVPTIEKKNKGILEDVFE